MCYYIIITQEIDMRYSRARDLIDEGGYEDVYDQMIEWGFDEEDADRMVKECEKVKTRLLGCCCSFGCNNCLMVGI